MVNALNFLSRAHRHGGWASLRGEAARLEEAGKKEKDARNKRRRRRRRSANIHPPQEVRRSRRPQRRRVPKTTNPSCQRTRRRELKNPPARQIKTKWNGSLGKKDLLAMQRRVTRRQIFAKPSGPKASNQFQYAKKTPGRLGCSSLPSIPGQPSVSLQPGVPCEAQRLTQQAVSP